MLAAAGGKCKQAWDRYTRLEKRLVVCLVFVSVVAVGVTCGLVVTVTVSHDDHEDCPENPPRYFGDVQLPGCPPIVSRAQWGARPPRHAPLYLPAVPEYVFIKDGRATRCFTRKSCVREIQDIQTLHMAMPRGWNDIGFNFVVGEDGNAYQGRGWDFVGSHTGVRYNRNGIAIYVIGDFTNHTPNALALHTVKQLIQCGFDNGKISPNYTLKGHRDVRVTASPGDAFYSLIQSWPHYAPSNDTWKPEATTVPATANVTVTLP